MLHLKLLRLERLLLPHVSVSLQHLKDVENIPELIVPETSEGFVGELDVIAREVSLGGTRFKISFSSTLPEEFNVQKLSLTSEPIFGD